jgi:hypothetical protein
MLTSALVEGRDFLRARAEANAARRCPKEPGRSPAGAPVMRPKTMR